jgi:hypothetical protein
MTIKDVSDGTHETRTALVWRDVRSTPRFWCLQTRFNAQSWLARFFAVDEDESLPEGPEGDDQFVNSR